MGEVWRSLSYGLRSLIRKPVFALAILLSLMLGIGTNTALFTLLDRLFLRPLPIEKPEQVLSIYQTLKERDSEEYTGQHALAHLNYLDYREKNQTFEGLALFQWEFLNLTGVDNPQRIVGMYATSNYFTVLGLQPQVGRFFVHDDDRTPHRLAVLSDAFWRRAFGADQEIVGNTVELNGLVFTVIGVAGPGFRGTLSSVSADFWIPLPNYKEMSAFGRYFENRDVSIFNAFGRLKEGVSQKQGEADLANLSRALSEEYLKASGESVSIITQPIRDGNFRPKQRESYEGYATILTGTVVIVLLLSCLNVANLLLVRARERRREIATRLAMGCSRAGIVRQLLVENLGVFVIGGLLSLPVARWSLDLLWSFRPPQIDASVLDLSLDGSVLFFALLVSLLTGVVFGLFPALRASNPDLVTSLKEGGNLESPSTTWRWLRPQNLLVIVQVALALVSLIGAGLFLRSLKNAQELDLGYHYKDMAVVSFSPGQQGYEEERARWIYREAVEKVAALPGVVDVAWASNRLLRGSTLQQQVFIEGQETAARAGDRNFHRTNIIEPGYFGTIGMPIVMGQDFTTSITADGPPVAIINETMAKIAWPGENPIGKRFSFSYPENPKIEVIGVAADAVYREIGEPEQFFLYLPLEQAYSPGGTVHARVQGDPAQILPLLRREVRSLDKNLVLSDLQPLGFFVEEGLWLHRMSARLLSIFGGLALLLAVIGVYSLLVYSVDQRRKEIATRVALGARQSQVAQTVLSEFMILVGIGWAVGFVLTRFGLAPKIASYLLDIEATDVSVYLVQSVVLVLAALVGTLIPVRRALKTDPMRVLRGD